jgi:DNA-binding response OmpR family regulator
VLDLTAREFDLLAYFVQCPGHVFTRAQLLDQVWGTTQDAFEHTVNSHINRLRAKLEPCPSRPRYIETIRSIGNRFCPTKQGGLDS